MSIGSISKLLGDENNFAIRALLNIIIDDTVKYFNVGKTMTGEQMVQTVELIVQDYKHFKPEDFKMCFSNAKKGHYGVVYDRIDGQVIFEWLLKYDNARDGEIEAIRAKENRVFKHEAALPLIPKLDDLKKEYTTEVSEVSAGEKMTDADYIFKSNMIKLRENLDKNKKEREDKSKAIVTERRINPIVDIHQKWINQFDAIWEKQKYPKNRMISRYGTVKNPFYFDGNSAGHVKTIKRQLDVNTFLEHKQWQYKLSQIPHSKRQAEYLKK